MVFRISAYRAYVRIENGAWCPRPIASSFSSVFSPGGHASPDMPLLLVDLQNLPDLMIQSLIILRQALRKIFVDGGF